MANIDCIGWMVLRVSNGPRKSEAGWLALLHVPFILLQGSRGWPEHVLLGHCQSGKGVSPIREVLVKALLLFSSAHILLSEASHRAEPRVRTGEVPPCPREEGAATLLGKGRGYREGSRIGSLNAVKSTTTHPDDPNYSGPSHMQNSPP